VVSCLALSMLATTAWADPPPIRVVSMYDKTGPYQYYGKEINRSFQLGLEYATHGTMQVAGRKIVVIEKDTQLKVDKAKAMAEEAYGDDGADVIVGPVGSAECLAVMRVAAQYKKLVLIPGTPSDSFTGKAFTRYMFRFSRNSTMDAEANAIGIAKPGVFIGTLAQDDVFGHDGITAFRAQATARGATIVDEEYLPSDTNDFSAAATRLFDALKDKPGTKYLFISWAGELNPWGKVHALNPERFNIAISSSARAWGMMGSFKELPGMVGGTYYYFGLPKNPINDWLVTQFKQRYGMPPELNGANSMATGIALVQALEKTGGDTNTEKLISALEGMQLDTAKGKMIIRKEDHQALQSMYLVRIAAIPGIDYGVPELIREIPIDELNVPLQPDLPPH
jgi:branched-chain amino acid transport system substrate-binding protein